MKLTAQLIISVAFILGFLMALHRCTNGREAFKPLGFKGVVITIIFYALTATLYWKAGLLSELLPK